MTLGESLPKILFDTLPIVSFKSSYILTSWEVIDGIFLETHVNSDIFYCIFWVLNLSCSDVGEARREIKVHSESDVSSSSVQNQWSSWNALNHRTFYQLCHVCATTFFSSWAPLDQQRSRITLSTGWLNGENFILLPAWVTMHSFYAFIFSTCVADIRIYCIFLYI
jgi:hypothetical protein